MTCSEFQNHFSDYHDSLGDPAFMVAASAHLDGCPECRRYRGEVEQGIEVLRSLPGPSVGDDFLPRLKHRIYHLEDGPALRRREMAGLGDHHDHGARDRGADRGGDLVPPQC